MLALQAIENKIPYLIRYAVLVCDLQYVIRGMQYEVKTCVLQNTKSCMATQVIFYCKS